MDRTEELLKRAEISLREAPIGFASIPIQVIDGRIYHPNLNEDGSLKKNFGNSNTNTNPKRSTKPKFQFVN